jgi:hypothetical protein
MTNERAASSVIGRLQTVFVPGLPALGIAVLGYAGFQLGAFIATAGVRSAVVGAFGFALAASILVSPVVLYTNARRRGLRYRAAVAGSILVPIAWHVKEVLRMSSYLPADVLVYGVLHQLYLALWAWVAASLAAAEIVRRIRRREGLALPAVVVAVVCLGLVVLFVAVDGGATFAEWYMQMYGLIFL